MYEAPYFYCSLFLALIVVLVFQMYPHKRVMSYIKSIALEASGKQ